MTRRESLQLGMGAIAGLVYPLSGVSIGMIPEKRQETTNSRLLAHTTQMPVLPEDWIKDLVVVAMPAAAAGGKNAGVYTASENGIVPWQRAIIRWLTSKNVRGNGAVLIRQEGPESGAGLTAIIDSFSEYTFEVLLHVPSGNYFGTGQEAGMQIWLAVLDIQDHIIARKQVDIIRGEWSKGGLSFSIKNVREIRCVVYAAMVKQYPCLYYADEFRLVKKGEAWWNSQNYFNGSRTTELLTDKRAVLLEQLTPDAVAGHNGVYLNWDGFYSGKGMVIGGGNWEQEYNHVSAEDPMLESFKDNGIAVDIDGEKISTSLLWPGYQMCHQAPAYRDYYLRRVARIAPEINLFSQDNINMPSFQGWGKGCFCKWCIEKFREWLGSNRHLSLVKNTGIIDFSGFDIFSYAQKIKRQLHKYDERIVLKDPVLKAFMLFNYISQAALWKDAVDIIKRSAGHPVAVMGNQYGNNGEKPYSVVLSQIGDVVCTESNIGTDKKLARFDRIKALLLVKLGFAAGEFKRPVWLQYSALFHSPVAAKSRLEFISAQSLANNGTPFTWATAHGASGWFFDTEAAICRFVQQHRYVFSRRDSFANVGLIYSLPTNIWRKYPAFGLNNEKTQTYIYSFATLLEEMHVAYEVNCWWHPLLGDDTVSLERLSRYKVIILPGIDCFTEKQLEALEVFQKKGGKIIILESKPIYYDEDLEPLKNQNLAWKKNALSINAKWLENYAVFAEKTAHVLRNALEEDALIQTDAPRTVWSSLQLSESRELLTLHLVNGNIDEVQDRFIPVKNSTWKVRLPGGFNAEKARITRMESSATHEDIPIEIKNGAATITIPLIEGYTIVVFFAGSALAVAEEAAKKRRTTILNIIKNAGNSEIQK